MTDEDDSSGTTVQGGNGKLAYRLQMFQVLLYNNLQISTYLGLKVQREPHCHGKTEYRKDGPVGQLVEAETETATNIQVSSPPSTTGGPKYSHRNSDF